MFKIELLLEAGLSQGIWCGLSIFLLFWVVKNNKERETRYMQQLDKCNTRETEYQKIIQTFTNEIVPKLDKMSADFREGLHMIRTEVDSLKEHKE